MGEEVKVVTAEQAGAKMLANLVGDAQGSGKGTGVLPAGALEAAKAAAEAHPEEFIDGAIRAAQVAQAAKEAAEKGSKT